MIELPRFPAEEWYIGKIKELLPRHDQDEKKKEERYLKLKEEIDVELKKLFPKDSKYKDITFEEFIVAPFTELKKMKSYVDGVGNDYFKEYVMDNKGKMRAIYKSPWKCIYNTYDKLVRCKVNIDIIKKYKIKCCPYCNEHFIFNRGLSAVAQLDHFFPRGEYPVFALCLYNLVPSCSACNHIKRETLMGISPHNHEFDFNNLKISYKPRNAGFLIDESAFDIDLKYVGKDKAEEVEWNENVDKLHLIDAYNYHKDYVMELITKYRCNSTEYIEMLQKEFPELIHSAEEAKRIVYGNYIEPKDYLKRPLAKMTHDIVAELEQDG